MNNSYLGATTFTLELADGDIITSQNRIVSLFKNANKYSHLLYDSQLHVKSRIGNDFYYEIYPDGLKAMRRSDVQTIIPNKFILTSELLEDADAVLKGEVDRCNNI
jgi:hypothetical protein